METTARRRLNSLCRHFQLPCCDNHVLLPASLSHRPVLLKSRQVENAKAEPVVIGGMVLDIHATPSTRANPRTTTPGNVHYRLGGVARNIAECISKLGIKPFMISVLGLDAAGSLLLEHWRSAGLSLTGIQKHGDVATAVVCNIFDPSGELVAAVASVEAIEKYLTPDWIQQFRGNIGSSTILTVDANLNSASLVASCQIAAKCDIPVWFEPVSVSKSTRITSVAKYVTFTSPNEDELIAMANALSSDGMFQPIERGDNGGSAMTSPESFFLSLKPAIFVLLERGIKIVVVTLGSHGVFLCSKEGIGSLKMHLKRCRPCGFGEQLFRTLSSNCPPSQFMGNSEFVAESGFLALHFPALPASVVRLTGAGDCLVGGAIASLFAGLDVSQSVAVGMAAAKVAVESEENVPGEFPLAKLADDAATVYRSAKVVFHQAILSKKVESPIPGASHCRPHSS